MYALDYSPDSLHRAIWDGNVGAVKSLLGAGIDLDAQDPQGCTPLSRAIERRQPEIAKLLIAQGAGVQARDKRTALMWAAKNGTLSLVQVLLSKGAAVDAVDKDGKTAMIWAEQAGHGDVTALLEWNEEGQGE